MSEDEVEVAPQPVEIALEVQVVLMADNPESPSPSPPIPSPEVPSPPQSPVGNLPSFMDFCTLDDLAELEQRVVNSRAARSYPELRVEEPEFSRNLKVFLRVMWGQQWELKFLRQSGEVLFKQLRAYLAGYTELTNFNSWQ